MQEGLLKELEESIKWTFTIWEGLVVRTESNMKKAYSYMCGQSVSTSSH